MDVILTSNSKLGEEQLIKYYCGANFNFTKKEVCTILNKNHGISITVRRIKYLCKKFYLF